MIPNCLKPQMASFGSGLWTVRCEAFVWPWVNHFTSETWFSHSSNEDQSKAPISPKFLNLGHSEKIPSAAEFPFRMLFWKFATRGQCEYSLALQLLQTADAYQCLFMILSQAWHPLGVENQQLLRLSGARIETSAWHWKGLGRLCRHRPVSPLSCLLD